MKMNAESKRTVKKILIWCGVTVLLCLLLVIAANLTVIFSAKPRVIAQSDAESLNADCILVLGAKIEGDYPSDVLKDRLDVAIELYQAGAAPKLLMSGDHGTDGYDEPSVMKRYAIEHGVPSYDIFCDHAGFNTYDSLARAKKVFGCQKIIAVTQGFHISRAVFLGKALDIDIYGVTSDRSPYKFSNHVRESLARVKAVFTAVFKPEPRYLGESVPITGDGRVTDDISFDTGEE
ncbi:MAG: YdcF family protein [Clostridia bacterium]|nr:YdcF family protein [Clostridia bacterium]